MKRIAFYGGSFDPVHDGHLAIAEKLIGLFRLDDFFFVPAFHAPHKRDKRVTSAFCRYAMLALATNDEPKIKISTVELNAPERPFTFETQIKMNTEFAGDAIFFVIGADSWNEIDTWRKWQTVLTQTNIIIVTRPGYEINFAHIPPEISERIVDLRNAQNELQLNNDELRIYITDAVFLNVSATKIRQEVAAEKADWRENVSPEVAKYIEKYELYKLK